MKSSLQPRLRRVREQDSLLQRCSLIPLAFRQWRGLFLGTRRSPKQSCLQKAFCSNRPKKTTVQYRKIICSNTVKKPRTAPTVRLRPLRLFRRKLSSLSSRQQQGRGLSQRTWGRRRTAYALKPRQLQVLQAFRQCPCGRSAGTG